MSGLRGLVAAVRFLTRVPLPGPETRAEDLSGAVPWFPLVGACVGLATAGTFTLSLRLWPATVAAALAVGAGLMLTGGFHEDGFTDAVDGLGGGWTRERVIEIMKDSRIGAYGAMGLWILLTLRWAALVALGLESLLALPFAMLCGRWSISVLLRALPTVSRGLAKEVHGQSGWSAPLLASLWLGAAVAGLWIGRREPLLPTLLAALGMTALWVVYLRRRMGGHSGDLLGAGCQLVEAAALLGWMAAR